MHSPSALTEHVSPNLAGFFLLDPVDMLGDFVPVLLLFSLSHSLTLQVGDGLVLGPLAVAQAGGDHGHADGRGGVEEEGQGIPVGEPQVWGGIKIT